MGMPGREPREPCSLLLPGTERSVMARYIVTFPVERRLWDLPIPEQVLESYYKQVWL